MLINGKMSPPVGAFGTQRRVKALQDTFLPPDFVLDLVHLAEPALGHLRPVCLKLILGKVPELSTEPISKIHEYTRLLQGPLHAPPNPTDKQGGVILPLMDPQDFVSHEEEQEVAEYVSEWKESHFCADLWEERRCRTCLH